MARMLTAVASGGNRLAWSQLPSGVRKAIEQRLDAPVTAAHGQAGGFSPGLASRLELADGRRVFVKAVSVDRNPDSPELFRDEARIAAALPPQTPAPRLLWSHDDGHWVALAFTDVDGRPPAIPWRADELRLVLGALEPMWATLTPPPLEIPTVAQTYAEEFTVWRTFANAVDPPDGLAGADAWAAANLDLLAELGTRWLSTLDGDTMLHGDLRADNLLLTDGGVVFVDWPSCVRGPAWADLLFMCPSLALQGVDPEAAFGSVATCRAAEPALADSLLAALAGLFIARSLRPPPPGLGRAALSWLRRRLGIAT
jgi:hypothetical protein